MSGYPLVALGEVLTLSLDDVPVDPERTYRIAGVYSFGKGLIERESRSGADVKYSTLRRLRPDQLVYARLNAWEGALAVVSQEFDDTYVSQEFPVFDLDPGQADPRYFAHLCRWSKLWDDLFERARGMGARTGARRLRVHPEQFLSIKIPLPDIDEQRRVAAKLDSVSDYCMRISQLEKSSLELSTALIASVAQSSSELMPIGDFVEQIRRPVTVDPVDEYSLLGVRWYGEGLFIREQKSGVEIAATVVYQIREGDFIYNRLFGWKGSFAIAGPEVDGCFVSGEFPTFLVDSSRLDPQYLLAVFRNPSSWERVADRSTGGTPTSRNRLKEKEFMHMCIPIPPIDEQIRISKLVSTVVELGTRSKGRARYLTGLTPSLLNQAFAGLL